MMRNILSDSTCCLCVDCERVGELELRSEKVNSPFVVKLYSHQNCITSLGELNCWDVLDRKISIYLFLRL